MTDFYGRPLKSDGGPSRDGYFDDSTSYYTAQPRDHPPLHRADSSSTPRRSPTRNKAPDPAAPDGVSPDLIAAITEKVKKELLEHLKQTGSIDDQRAPPMQRDASNKSSSTSSPPPRTQRVYTPPSPTQPVKSNARAGADYMRSPPNSPLDKPSNVRFSDREFSSRPPAGRTYSTTELSTIDQKWGRLFESEATPTPRLGQVLRGLANFIIDDFPPKKSIVVTPAKMQAYYTNYALDNEPHPLRAIFGQPYEHISSLYRAIGCEHHLIQEDPYSAPVIPSLTPVGFAHWMTVQILAHPDEESKRLDQVVLAMPIDADGDLVDGKPERLPKQISRYLLPERPDPESKKLLNDAISDFLDDLGSTDRRKASITSPPLSRHSSTTNQSRNRAVPVEIHQAKVSPTSGKPNPLERERKPYSGTPAASESSNHEEPVQIERERAPYTAKEGSGKNYTENPNLNSSSRLGRANSTTTRNTARTQNDIPEPRHHRAPSNTNQGYMPPPRSRPRRTSSPPLKSFSQSTPSDINSKYGPDPSSSSSSFANQSSTFNPSSYSSTSSFPPPPPPPIDLHRRSRDDRSYRTDIDDDIRFPSEFQSPRDAEKWDRYQDARGSEPERFDAGRSYDRSSMPIDPRDRGAGAPMEDWYREKGRGAEYDPPFGSSRRY